MSSVPQISGNAANAANALALVDTKDIVKSWPEEVIYECSKHINKLCDIRTLSSLSKHFFLVVFNDKFPRWQTLLTSHFPTSFQLALPISQPIACYKHLKAINDQFKAGTYQTSTIHAHSSHASHHNIQDGNLISGSSSDRSISIWDLKSGDLQFKVPLGHQQEMTCLEVKGKKFFSGSNDRTIKIWDLEKGEMLHKLEGHQGAILALKESDGKLVSTSTDQQIKVWDIASGKLLQTLVSSNVNYSHIIIVKDDKLICDSFKTINICDLKSGNLISSINTDHNSAICHLEAQDGKIISADNDGIIKIWDFNTGTLLHTLDKHQGSICSLLANDGKLISTSYDSTIKIWDLESGQELHSLRGHAKWLTCLSIKDGMIISGSFDRTIKIWDLESGQLLRTLVALESYPVNLQVKDERLVAGLVNGKIKIFDFTPPSESAKR